MEEPPLKIQKKEDSNDKGNIGSVLRDLFTEKYSITPQHGVGINTVKFSPDGKRLLTCSSDGRIEVYNVDDGKLLTTLRGHLKGVSDVTFSPIDYNIIASCSDDLTVRLWSISKGKCVKVLRKHTYHVTNVKFSRKGNILITASADETITIWDIMSGVSLKTLAAHSDPISSIALSPDSTLIASGSYDGLMRLFDLESGHCLKTLSFNTSSGTATASTTDVLNSPISHVEFSPNGKYILSSSLDGYLRLWDYMDNKVMKTYSGPKEDDSKVSTSHCCGSKFITRSSSPLIISGSEKSGLLFWDVQTKEIVSQIKKTDTTILDVDVYDGGSLVAYCTIDGVISLLDMNTSFKDAI
ncbi:Piso0_004383 [Millerozyma farinosa CBS 7064]|uniref:Piso0_004383 protein n=1 Tax=Pichia sorbitophila (strain ATCC MYA-4447 / BCRC 22081 / CBS 7064 / NBRC 10061 / NRRL Y-12695) TaxID=559304 RepID=G8Y8N1_PICSO|nr:Piso0_004383 [Millerozyma farinosa CBS 7064]CCE84826.1 Piso0_004383 [Millerozyma farinosa CBS 7064]